MKILHSIFLTLAAMAIVIGYQIFGATFSLMLPVELHDFWMPYIMAASQVALILLPAIYISKWSEPGLRNSLRLTHLPKLYQIGLGVAGILVLQVFAGSYGWLQEQMLPDNLHEYYTQFRQTSEDMLITILGGGGMYGFFKGMLVGAVVPAICEETLFRGWLQSRLEERLGWIAAIIVAGLAFGLIHFNPVDFVSLSVIGIFLGISAWASKSLLLPVLLHFFNNAIGVSAINLYGIDTLNTDDQQPDVMLVVAVFFISIVLLVFISKKLILTSGFNVNRLLKK